jgi:hypothetical protein
MSFMKKILLALILVTGISVYTNAQTTPAKTKKPATTSTTKPATASATKPATTSTAAGPTKKDGSADMRYKANKDAAKATPATTHTKKDGTADKRYKENKK